MLSPVVRVPGLVTGERLTVEEFLRRWEETPGVEERRTDRWSGALARTVEAIGEHIIWRMLENGAYVAQALLSDGVLRSHVYPGLWLDVPAFWANGGAKMLQVLNA